MNGTKSYDHAYICTDIATKKVNKITQVLLSVMWGRLITHQMWMWRYFCIKPQLYATARGGF